jgi:hypothetical protein
MPPQLIFMDKVVLLGVIFFRSSGYRYMVCPAISFYSFGATVLMFCMMFIYIMEVDLFIISYGQANLYPDGQTNERTDRRTNGRTGVN